MKWMIAVWLLLTSQWGLAETPARIVTIGGAMTEIVYALGEGDQVVGNDTTSYFPKAAETKPKVGYQRMLSAEGIMSLQPDLVILTDEAGPPVVVQQIQSSGIKVLQLKASRSVDDIKASIRQIAIALSCEEKGIRLIDKLKQQQLQLQRLTKQQHHTKKVMFILQHGGGSPMVAGSNTAADSIINIAGGHNVVTGYQGYQSLTPEAAVSLSPDVILITTLGLEQMGGREALLSSPGIAITPAAKQGKLIAMDPLMLIGFGPRTLETAIALNKAFSAL